MDRLVKSGYEFAGFRLDLYQQVLVAPDGELIPLPGRAFEVLRHLVERPGELVEKQTLLRAAWPHSVVEENNLSQCIMTLRRALGEGATDRRFILTVPGRGFKFVAPVRELNVASDGGQPVHSGDLQPGPLNARAAAALGQPTARRLALGLGSVLAAFLVLFLLTRWSARPLTDPAEYIPLTDVSDSATAPAISPDGRLLAFIRDGDHFLSTGQIWIKRLPDGEPLQLTHEGGALFAPAFTTDGTRVAYSVVSAFRPDVSWDTWTVPISGGAPVRLLPNASGLTFLGPHEVLYSEFKSGIHLGISTSLDDRSGHRDVYLPGHERAMAHYSYLSPDRRSILVVEMGGNGGWQPCRLVPFDGSSPGRTVGPENVCISAAWSPDGRWMYFSIAKDGHAHLWRQRYPKGDPEQITFGAGDEETVAVAPDGKSLLTAMGRLQSALWIHEAAHDRRLTTEGIVLRPWLSPDARRVYFQSVRDSSRPTWEVLRMDIASGRTESLLPGFEVMAYDISADEREIVFTTRRDGAREIWLAPLDRHAAPARLVHGGDEAVFDGKGAIFYRSLEGAQNHLHRIAPDGGASVRVLAAPILELVAVAPDGRNAVVGLAVPGGTAAAFLAPLDGGAPRMFPSSWTMTAHWSRDGDRFLVDAGSEGNALRGGRALSYPLGADGLPVPGAEPSSASSSPHTLDATSFAVDAATYTYIESATRRNIYRIPLH